MAIGVVLYLYWFSKRFLPDDSTFVDLIWASNQMLFVVLEMWGESPRYAHPTRLLAVHLRIPGRWGYLLFMNYNNLSQFPRQWLFSEKSKWHFTKWRLWNDASWCHFDIIIKHGHTFNMICSISYACLMIESGGGHIVLHFLFYPTHKYGNIVLLFKSIAIQTCDNSGGILFTPTTCTDDSHTQLIIINSIVRINENTIMNIWKPGKR
jgi:hypothetical protein